MILPPRVFPKSAREIWLLIRVAGVLIGLSLFVRSFKLRTVLRWLTPSRYCRTMDPPTFEKTVAYTDGIVRRLHLFPRGNCLPRSLALYYFATRCGLPVHVCCGIRRVRETLEGHAWLDLNGKPFLEHGNPELSYTVTFCFPTTE